jgi:hypothetical protein
MRSKLIDIIGAIERAACLAVCVCGGEFNFALLSSGEDKLLAQGVDLRRNLGCARASRARRMILYLSLSLGAYRPQEIKARAAAADPASREHPQPPPFSDALSIFLPARCFLCAVAAPQTHTEITKNEQQEHYTHASWVCFFISEIGLCTALLLHA